MDLDTIKEEEKPTLDTAEIVSTGNHLNLISNILNASNSPFMTKSPTLTPPKSHTPSSKHIPSPKLDQNIYLCSIMPSLKPTSESEIIPRASALKNLISHLAVELPSEQNQLACISDCEQPQPINIMFGLLIEV